MTAAWETEAERTVATLSGMIDEQRTRLAVSMPHCHPEQALDMNGRPILADLIAAKANLLAAIMCQPTELATCESLPIITGLTIGDGDTLVVGIPYESDADAASDMAQDIADHLPGVQVVIVCGQIAVRHNKPEPRTVYEGGDSTE